MLRQTQVFEIYWQGLHLYVTDFANNRVLVSPTPACVIYLCLHACVWALSLAAYISFLIRLNACERCERVTFLCRLLVLEFAVEAHSVLWCARV
jgi:hypothetical protein